jgi:hypothetical protein
MTDQFRKAHRPLSEAERAHLDALKDHATVLAGSIEAIGPGRETSLALTHLEEAVMWASKALTAAPPEPEAERPDPDLAEIVG